MNTDSATVTNDGTIFVQANGTGTAASVNANGILFSPGAPQLATTQTSMGATVFVTETSMGATGTTTDPANVNIVTLTSTGVATINNSGTIIAQEDVDNDGVFEFGAAINTNAAPNAVNINLLGGGTIYGNIEISDDDAITVSDGETSFEGIVNSDMALEGSLVIAPDGTLYLRNDLQDDGTPTDPTTYAGPSKVYVDTFTVSPDGILALELPNTGDATLETDYPQVFADTATITDGLLEVRFSIDNQLIDDSYVYLDVIDANTLIGEFADVYTNPTTLFVDVEAVYDGNTVDLYVDRVAFDDDRFGLTPNQGAAAGGIENVYDPNQDGPFGDLLQALQAFDDADDYAAALSQLTGNQFGAYVQSLGTMGQRFNGVLSDMGECLTLRAEDAYLTCDRTSAGVWAHFNYAEETIDSDPLADATGLDSKQYLWAAGVDFTLGDSAVLGIGGGYLENRMTFDQFNGAAETDGYQIGVYGAYDPGTFYLKGSANYSMLDTESVRAISFPGFVGGRTFSEQDADILALGAELGYRLNLGGFTLTPYAGIDYAKVEVDNFAEDGVPGADLTIASIDEDFTTSELGAKLGGQFGWVYPEVKAAWRHSFDADPVLFGAQFSDAPAGSSFVVQGPAIDEDALVLGASLTAWSGGPAALKVGYEGWIADRQEIHSGFVTLRYQFGGAEPLPVAPPPAPVPAPPPPPPPAPVVEETVCNTGPYIVFFDWDESVITPAASQILDSAITAYGDCGMARIMLAGYTDTSGSQAYNLGLAARRNASVRDYLTARSVPDARITSEAFGEENLRVPTADGVRELQNRRVEITYGPGSGM